MYNWKYKELEYFGYGECLDVLTILSAEFVIRDIKYRKVEEYIRISFFIKRKALVD